MKYLSLLLILLLPVLSCKEEDPDKSIEVCGVKDPVRNLSWLKDLIEKISQDKLGKFATITLLDLNGEPVFNYQSIEMSCIGCVTYHCDGSRVDMKFYTPAFQDNLFNKKGPRVQIWPEE